MSLSSRLAEQDLESIADYIAKDSPRRALSFIRELRDQCKRIHENPQGYRARPELGIDTRSCPYGSYVVFFDMHAQDVSVLRVLHAARDVAAIFNVGAAENDE